LARTAAGGTLKRTPATITGMAGASSDTRDLGHVGHSRYETKVATAARSAAAIASAARRLRDFHPVNLERAIACALMPVLCRHANQIEVSHGK
jgi:hypothetical protein